jgi:hypothetical protein
MIETDAEFVEVVIFGNRSDLRGVWNQGGNGVCR